MIKNSTKLNFLNVNCKNLNNLNDKILFADNLKNGFGDITYNTVLACCCSCFCCC